jgi:hypothetical protein
MTLRMVGRRKVASSVAVALLLLLMGGRSMRAQEDSSLSTGGLGSIAILTPHVESRMVSPENPTGQKGKGGMGNPDPKDPDLSFSAAAADMGRGWKVRPFIKVPAHSTATMMDVEGPGTIKHIWIASSADLHDVARFGVLRFYWDGEASPSVEVPLGDFFAVGNGKFAPITSAAVVDIPLAALNCYWPMPFAKHARITFTNDSDHELGLLTYQIDYEAGAIPPNAGYFHAQWRRERVQRSNPSYTILDGVKGEGRYVGTFLSWNQLSSGWSGEGEVKFYTDGDSDFPTIVGTGTEDYFGADWGFPENYSTPYVGAIWTNKNGVRGDHPMPATPSNDFPSGSEWSLYRWHIPDPITFHHDLKVTIQDLGWWPNGRYQPLDDDFASTAFWYQKEPHAPFPKLPPVSERWTR